MAKKSGKPGKAEAIREYSKNNPKAGPSEIAKALSAEGYEVSAAYVSTIKSLAKKRKGKRGRPRGTGAGAPRKSGDSISIAMLMQAKSLASKLGGVAEAKAALDALAKLGM